MSLVVWVLLFLIAYFIARAFWRIYRAVEVDRSEREEKPLKRTYRDEFGEECEVEDVRWRDLP